MSDPHDLSALYHQCWHLLGQAVASNRSLLRFVTLSTIGLDGSPQSRTVVLRHVDPALATLSVYTDMRSTKVAELSRSPTAAVHLWAPDALVQLRLNGTALVSPGSTEEWTAVPDTMREAYGHVPPPATPIDQSNDWLVSPDAANFARITLNVDRIDFVSLDPNGHHRAQYTRSSGWSGTWVSP